MFLYIFVKSPQSFYNLKLNIKDVEFDDNWILSNLWFLDFATDS